MTFKDSKKVKDYFNDYAKNYDKLAFNESLGLNYVSDFEISKLYKYKDLKILDLGFGTGRNSSILAKQGCLINGIDISEKMIESGIKKIPKNKIGKIVVSDLNKKLPFKEGFDMILCFRVLKYLKNWENVFKESARLLKKNGTFVLEFSNKTSVQSFGAPFSHYSTFFINQIKLIGKKYNFKVDNIYGGSILPLPLYRKIKTERGIRIIHFFEQMLKFFKPTFSRNVIIEFKKVI